MGFFYLGLERDLRENLEKRERRETKIEERIKVMDKIVF